MAAAKEIRRMGKRANELQAQITELSEQGKDVDALLNEYGQVQDRFEHLGGYELESNARKILSGLGFKVTDFERPCSEFSGGWQMRIALAKLFLRHPDLLLLDEPTNHLDFATMECWKITSRATPVRCWWSATTAISSIMSVQRSGRCPSRP